MRVIIMMRIIIIIMWCNSGRGDFPLIFIDLSDLDSWNSWKLSFTTYESGILNIFVCWDLTCNIWVFLGNKNGLNLRLMQLRTSKNWLITGRIPPTEMWLTQRYACRLFLYSKVWLNYAIQLGFICILKMLLTLFLDRKVNIGILHTQSDLIKFHWDPLS